MSFEWYTPPEWTWANNATPIDIEYYWRRFYPVHTLNPGYAFDPIVTANFAGVRGFYEVAPDMSSAYYACDNNVYGVYPISWLGEYHAGVPTTYYRNVMTINYPSANRTFALRIWAYQIAGSQWALNIYGRWFKTDDMSTDSSITEGTINTTLGWETQVMGEPGCVAFTFTHNAKTLCGVSYINGDQNPMYDPTKIVNQYVHGVFIDVEEFTAWVQSNHPDLDFSIWDKEDDPVSPEAGPASGAGGYGGYGGDITASDSIPVPALPSASAAALGFINMYNPSSGGLTSLGEEIFPDFDFTSIVDPTGDSVINAILNACAAFVDCFNQIPAMFKMFINSRLIDYVQDCHIVPVAPTTGASAHIKLGFRELDTTAITITTEYKEEDLGVLDVTEFYKSFIDYLPYTRAKLYLPFIGFVPIEPEYWQSGRIGVVYHFNVYDGSFMAYITASPNGKISQMRSSVIGQYAGTAIIHLPLTGLNYSSMVAGLVGGTGAAMAAIGSGNITAGLTAAINTATASPQVMTSNGYTASASFLSCRYPFLIIERSVSHFPQNYQHDVGIPSKITTTLASASGFTTIGDIDLSSVSATDREKDEIRSILASGIYV